MSVAATRNENDRVRVKGTTLVVPRRTFETPGLAVAEALAGAEAQINNKTFSARLKPCPDTKRFVQ
jgi:hypothetical protein